MAKYSFFVDGFNFYHALDCYDQGTTDAERHQFRQYKWLSLIALAKQYLTSADTLASVDYFTTLVTWDPDKVERHKKFIRAQENEGVNVVYGQFKRDTVTCRAKCKRVFDRNQEKETDINIALRLFELAHRGVFDRAVLVTGDSDQLSTIKTIKRVFPGVEIGIMLPVGKASEELKREADFVIKMKRTHLAKARYDDKITLSDGTVLLCPDTWKPIANHAAPSSS